MSTQQKKIISSGIILGYILIKFGFDSWWRSISEYYGYGFEVIFVLAVGWTFRKSIILKFPINRQVLLSFLLSLLSGFIIYRLITYSGLIIPFQFDLFEMIFLLLVISPILEELIFRMALWEPIKCLVKEPVKILILTSILFSLAHLMAIWVVPYSFKPFVLIQALYALLLGLGAGYRRLVTGSVLAAMIIHFGFNLGFYFASFGVE